MLKHVLHNSEWRCADYTFSLGIVCMQATLHLASSIQSRPPCASDMLLFLGLNGKTNLEAAKIDMLCDGVRDIFDKMFAVLYHETDPERKVTTGSRNCKQPVFCRIYIFAHTWPLCFSQILVDWVKPY